MHIAILFYGVLVHKLLLIEGVNCATPFYSFFRNEIAILK